MPALAIVLDAEIDRTIRRAIGQILRHQFLNQLEDRRHMLGGARQVLRTQAIQRIQVL